MKNVLRQGIALLLILPSALLIAQITGGSIVGNVTDQSGAVMGKVVVQATNLETGAGAKTITSETGRYEFPLLPAGTYTVSAEAPGFQRAVSKKLELHAGTQPRIDFAMVVGQVTSSVEVEAAGAQVNTTNTELGVVIDSGKVKELPLNGRDFTQLLALQPGWSVGSSAAQRGGVQVNGSPGLGNNFLLDGVDMSLGETNGVGLGAIGARGATINTVSIEAMEEFKTTTGAFAAEYGHATGGVINLVTKSGGNAFHGTLWEFFRNDKLDANTFFANRASSVRPPLRFNQYGGNLGGPIWRNKVFFFFNYEGAKVRRAVQVTGNVPTDLMVSEVKNPILAADLAKLPRSYTPTSDPLIGSHFRNDRQIDDELTTLSRLDAYLGKNRLAFRLAYNDQNVSNPTLRQDIRQFLPIPVKNWEISDVTTFSPTLLNEARFGYNHYPIARHLASVNPGDNAAVPGCCSITAQPRAIDSPAITFNTMDLLAADTPTKMFVDNLTWIRGAHTLKAGFEARVLNSKRTQFGQGAWMLYNSTQDIVNDKVYQVELDFGNPGRGFDFSTYGAYAQDDWKINRRLQVNFGLRYEYYTVLSGPIGLQTRDPFGPLTAPGAPLWNPRRTDFGPRAGLVFDVFGNGTTIFRAGAGISYSAPQPIFYYDSQWISAAVPAFPVVLASDLPASLQPVTYPFPDSFLQAVRKDPSLAPPGMAAAAGRYVSDPGRKDDHVEMWNASLQRQMTHTLALQVSYVGNRALNLATSQNFNLVSPLTGSRPSPLGPITYIENSGTSWYNALQVAANKKLSHNLSFDAYFTSSRTMQYHGAGTIVNGVQTQDQDPNNFAASIGPAAGSVRNLFTLVHSYEIPTPSFVKNSGAGKALLGGWTVQGIMSARSGPALNVTLGFDAVGNGYGGSQRPDAVAGQSQYAQGLGPLVFLNRAAYSSAGPRAQQRFGNLGYDTAEGPGGFGWDAGIHKTFEIHEQHRITFRLEMFNWMNHPIFTAPSVKLSDPNFGIVNSTGTQAGCAFSSCSTGGARNIQMALKYSF